jgi:hypothetical protein
MAKKAKKAKRASKKRASQKRDLVKGRAKSYAKRTARGRFKEMDTVSRSQRTDTVSISLNRPRSQVSCGRGA